MDWPGDSTYPTPEFLPDIHDLQLAPRGQVVVSGNMEPVRSRVRHKKSASDTFAWAAAPYVDFNDRSGLMNLVETGNPSLSPYGHPGMRPPAPSSWGLHSGGLQSGGPHSQGLNLGSQLLGGGGIAMRSMEEVSNSGSPIPGHPNYGPPSSGLTGMSPQSGGLDTSAYDHNGASTAVQGGSHRRGASLDGTTHTGFSKAMKESLGVEKPLPNFATQTRANAFDPAQLDPKRAKRIIANRQSAHRSRVKKLQQVHHMEQELADVRNDVKMLHDEVQRMDFKNKELQSSAQMQYVENLNFLKKLDHSKRLGVLLQQEVARLHQLLSTKGLVRPELIPEHLQNHHQQQRQQQKQLDDPLRLMETDDGKSLADMWERENQQDMGF